MKTRLDKLVLERGLASSRERAQSLILAGRVLVNGQKVDKAGAAVPDESELRLLGGDLKYVSRGGLKLERALDNWNIDVAGLTCMDVGASTGGFTDCFLQRGAAQVIAVDTGYGQMDAGLRADPRVKLLERTNARYLTVEQVIGMGGQEAVPGIAAMDVSFISATLVLPAVVEVLKRAAGPRKQIIVLVKPQFEVGREQVGKGGIVRDPKLHAAAVEKVRESLASLGIGCAEGIDSPILGTEGNREFLLYGEF